MIEKLTIKNINDFIYELENESHNKIKLKIQFFDYKPEIGDKIYILDSFLKDIKDNLISFGNLDNKTGKNLKEIEKKEILKETIILKKNNEKIYLKRLYG